MKALSLIISVFCGLLMIQLDATELYRNENSNVSKKDFHLYLLMSQSNMARRGFVQSIDTINNGDQ
ncbi:hypothetical protein [Algoriphagus halophilus]|uniref:Uncharacterized protein n=1 Tax=Algoriphagus halophilus TaxID=226505 RepID=A0A1N6D795_9BACT|nr:hypothetical protein [Algoriphagus halophilus]SIN66524.1 hypothetical protein SAMN05444394_0362 [Algoriphagus halophilus]